MEELSEDDLDTFLLDDEKPLFIMVKPIFRNLYFKLLGILIMYMAGV